MKRKAILLFFTTLIVNVTHSQNFLNPSFEAWGAADTCYVIVPPNSWTNYSTGSICPDKVNFQFCPTTYPAGASDGNSYARMYSPNDSQGEGMFQNLTGFLSTDVCTISFDYSGTSYILNGPGQQQFHLFIDDIDVAQTSAFSPTDSTWITFNYTFSPTNINHKIGIRLFALLGYGSGAVDNFRFVKTSTVGLKTSNPAFYTDAIKALPNPNPGTFKITDVTNSKKQIIVFNELGKTILTRESSDYEVEIDITTFGSGCYFVTIVGENIFRTQKILVGN